MEKNVNKAAEGSAPRWLGQFAGAVKKKWAGFSEIVTHGNFRVACSMFLMGTGQMMYKQWAKGALYLLIQAGSFAYFILAGAADLFGLFTLGTVEANPWYGIEGDDSVLMLITGILSNANKDQYEAARIDGANAFQQFWYLTLPFVVFATTPVILSQFIGNFNNFGVFYFLRSDVAESAGYVLANDTDLLINWLYKMSIDNNYYSIGAAISLIIFLITSVISLVVYIFSPSYRQEETYR